MASENSGRDGRGDDPTQVRLEPWINHDIRRVVRSALPALGVEDHVSELVLGHARKGLAGNYDLFKYAPQIRAALDAWAARLREIITPTPSTPPAKPSNVVRLVAR